uniref:Dinitrogenase iron-molybdenum cofactor biosynthesis domain-containing protein n=1 Tax=Desulfomonile tiedjei TaxID=2358 RepID=A0A7C4ARW2_9BACT
MRIAVSEYQGRIAPVFDTCRRVLIFLHTAEGDSEVGSEDWSSLARHLRPDRLVQLSIETVLCGGISCWMNDQITARGLTLIPWLSGNVQEILMAYRNGAIFAPEYAMPGWTGCRARAFRATSPNALGRGRFRVRKGEKRCLDSMERDH